MKSKPPFFLFITLLSVALIILFSINRKNSKSFVTIGDNKILVEIVRSSKDMAKGLSGKTSLEENSGMLFIYNKKVVPIFWMKDMNFPIDIIWINDNKIVDITKNVPKPEENESDLTLPRYKPAGVVDTVLEVNAGFCDENGIEIDNEVKISV